MKRQDTAKLLYCEKWKTYHINDLNIHSVTETTEFSRKASQKNS